MRKALSIIIIITLISCQKENVSLIGTVKVTFLNAGSTGYNDIHPQIFLIEDVKIPLIDILEVNSQGETEKMELNYGNYYLTYRIQSSNNSYYNIRSKIFQVKAGKETHLIVDFYKE